MQQANQPDEGDGSSEIKDLLQKLSGRVTNELWVIDGRTRERRLLCSYDFDKRDSVDIVFKADPKDLEGDDEPGTVTYSFCLNDHKPGEEVDSEMAGKQSLSQQDLDAFGKALCHAEPTYRDYMDNVDIEFEDLSLAEKCKVLEHDLDILLDVFDSFGYQNKSSEPGFFGKLFGKKQGTA